MAARRAGTTGRIGHDGRSHDAPDCGSYRLVRRVAPNTWLVEWTAACDGGGTETSEVRFISRAAYDRYF